MKLDLSYLEEVSGGDQDLFQSLLVIMQDELSTVWEEFELYRTQTDYEGMHRVVHTLKSKLDIMKLENEAVFIRQMELNLGNETLEIDDHENLRILLEELNDKIKNI